MAGSEWSGAIAVAAFVASYVGLGLGRVPPFRVDRTGVAIIGATLMVMLVLFLAGVPIAIVAIAGAGSTLLTRRVKPEKVYREVNWGLLVLFAGLFVITAGLERSGIMDVFLHWAAAANLDRPAVLTVVAAVLSNLVSNVPAVLLVKPLVASFAEPRRAWLVLAMASTLAGNLTILGSVANLIVVETARAARVEIGFVEYAKVGVPLTLVTLLLGWLLLALAAMPVTRGDDDQMAPCPYCAEAVKTDAVVCPHCRSSLDPKVVGRLAPRKR